MCLYLYVLQFPNREKEDCESEMKILNIAKQGKNPRLLVEVL
jgi:hypothetical protein